MVSKNKRKNIKKMKKRTKKRKNKCKLNLEKAIIKILKDYENCLNKNKQNKNKKKNNEGGIIYDQNIPLNVITDMNLIDEMRNRNPNISPNTIRDTLNNIPMATDYDKQRLSVVDVIKEKKNEGRIIVPFADYLDMDVEDNRYYTNRDDINKNIEIKKKTQTICAYCKKKFKINEKYTTGNCGCLYHINCLKEVYKKKGDISIFCFNCNSSNKFKTKPWNDRTTKCLKCEATYENDSIITPQCNVICVSCNSYLKWISYEDCNPIKRKNIKMELKSYRYGSINQKIKKKIKKKMKTFREKFKKKMKTMRKKSNRIRTDIFTDETNNQNDDNNN